MHVELDDIIPFNEFFIIPYVTWFFYVFFAIIYFFFVSKEDYYRLCVFLFAGMTASLVVCELFPNGTDLRQAVDPTKNICAWAVSQLHKVDTNTNVFPSVHAFNSLGVHLAVTHSPRLKERHALRICSFVVMVAICLSTMFLKQHSVVDVVGAIVLAYVIYPFVYARTYAANRRAVRQRQNAAG